MANLKLRALQAGPVERSVSQSQNIVVNVPTSAETTKPSMASDRDNSTADQIERFAKLLDQGLITREEFDAQKAKVLFG